MRRKLLILSILIVAVPGLFIQGQEGNVNGLENLKKCLDNIVQSHIIPLGREVGKAGILKKLRSAEEDFKQCGIKDGPAVKEEILKLFSRYIKEADGFNIRGRYTTKSKTYSEKLDEKFQQLINLVDDQIAKLKTQKQEVKEKKEETPPKKPAVDRNVKGEVKDRNVVEDKKEEEVSKRDFFLWLQGESQAYVLQLIILLVVLFALIYFFVYKRLESHVKGEGEAVRHEVAVARNTIIDALTKMEAEMVRQFHKVNKKLDYIVYHLKDASVHGDIDAGIRREDQRQTPFREQDDLGVREWESEQERAPEVRIDFPVMSFPEKWKNQILHKFNERQDRIIDFSQQIRKTEVIREWFKIVGRRLKEYSQDTEKTFFKSVYPSIKTLRSKLTKQEFEEFEEIFFKAFLSALDIEEFGRRGEQYEPDKHTAYMKEGDRGGGRVYVIQKVDIPGYRMRFGGEILEKAHVVL